MITWFCKYQHVCTDCYDDEWICTAHIDYGLAPKCPYIPNDIQEIDGVLMITKKDELIGRCQDFEPRERIENASR